ncbi:hypothetical protein QIT82_gp41 [Pseudomonas phage psageK9]|uniref:Uncharacterized protein n=1 Tax=Pseudomonas phage psageK9 TaxID=2875722 RepID=A0AAE9BT18_9CAUD|nr:hypothetical protein QIT82_gp41 [Pseudomonas phage psageK9]UAW53911.1 hypothetical protein psageK9_41c [Pseudomonas phage psageK9]
MCDLARDMNRAMRVVENRFSRCPWRQGHPENRTEQVTWPDKTI